LIRAFLALDFDERFLDEVASLAASLRGRSRLSRAKWVGRAAMHVTVRFLGDVDDASVPALQALVRDLAAGIGERGSGERGSGEIGSGESGRGEVRVRARSLGAFPDARRARVLVVDLEEPRGVLEAIAKGAEAEAVRLGFPAETRAWRPHLTLARIREGADLRDVLEETRVDLEGRVTALTLYQSELGKGPNGGPLYVPLERAALG
jgi:2'-5' RNA ligase